jgi:hypothetical protein
MNRTEKTEVTEAERLQLMGLLMLAQQHNAKLKDIHQATQELTGETEECGHCSDFVYSQPELGADLLLKNLGIKVRNDAAINSTP